MDSFNTFWDALNVPTMSTEIGITGYLDGIETSDLSAPVMKGLDKYGRKFIAIKAFERIGGQEFAPGRFTDVDTAEVVVTFFQRYHDDSHLWVVCKIDDTRPFCEEGKAPYPSVPKVKDFLKGETLKFEDDFNKIQYNIVR